MRHAACRNRSRHGPTSDHGIAEVLMIAWRVRASAASIPDRAHVGRVRCPDRVRPSRVRPDPPVGLSPPPGPDRVVFDHVIAALVHGSGYERVATVGCSDRTIRRRLEDWAHAGVGEAVLATALAGYDQ